MQRVQQQVTVESILHELQTKNKLHNNERANPKRMAIIQTQQQQVNKNTYNIHHHDWKGGCQFRHSFYTCSRQYGTRKGSSETIQMKNHEDCMSDPKLPRSLLTILQRLKSSPGKTCRVSKLSDLLLCKILCKQQQ